MIRVLGLDPGLRCTGWGLIDTDRGRLSFVAAGTVTSLGDDELPDRLLMIHKGISEMIAEWSPDEIAVEETVVNRNPGSSLKLGYARGVVILSAAMANRPVWEYSAKRVKQSVTGTGAAKKDQVKAMVRRLLPKAVIASADANDALAVALCHASSRQFERAVSLGGLKAP